MKNKQSQFAIAAKRLVLLVVILSAGAFLQPAKSQARVNINLQPLWGPVGYDRVDYYYFPAQEVYYYVPRRQFVYLDGGSWRFASALPSRYGSIDYYTTYKVVVNEPKAYLKYKTHKVKYVGGGKHEVIRDSRDAKYYVVKGHPHYYGGKKSAGPARSGNSGNVKSSSSKSHSSGNSKASPASKGNQGNAGKSSSGKSSGGGKGKGGKH